MVIDSLITFLQMSVNAAGGIKGLRIYAFGSVLLSDAPADVDLAIVFDPTTVGIADILAFRRHLRGHAGGVFDVPLDICLLTEEEARNNPFLEEEGAIQIYRQQAAI